MKISNKTARQFNVKLVQENIRLTVRLVPTLNEVDDKTGEALKKDVYFQSLIKDGHVSIGGEGKSVKSQVSSKPNPKKVSKDK